MTVATEEKLIRRWVGQLQPFGRGRTYTPALRRRILEFVELAKASGIAERECCKSIGVSPTSIAAWRRAARDVALPEATAPVLDEPREMSAAPISRALVPVEVTSSSVPRGRER